MPYVIFSVHSTTMYFFLDDEISVYMITTDPEKAKTFKTRKEARIACKSFQEASNMRCRILKT